MTIQAFLDQATKQLKRADIATARLDCLVLLEDVTGRNRAQLLAHLETELTEGQLDQLQAMVSQRVQHIPLAFVRGKTEFYGREFLITPAVLEPRPESETMIEMFTSLVPDGEQLTIVDVGTGSGAIGITAAMERPDCEVTLVDIDEAALAVAAQNCERFELTLSCVVDDLMSHAARRGVQLDMVLANLPYVPDDYTINRAALHEPKHAIFGGPDGLDLYRRLFEQCELLQPAFILTESLPFQHETMSEIAHKHGYTMLRTEDFIQMFSHTEAVEILQEELAKMEPNSASELPTQP